MRLTKLPNVVSANERALKFEEYLVNVDPPLVAHLQPPKEIDPRQRLLHHLSFRSMRSLTLLLPVELWDHALPVGPYELLLVTADVVNVDLVEA